MEQPCAVLELCKRVVEEAGVDDFLDLIDFFNGRVPIYRKDLAGKFAPGGLSLFVAVGCLVSVSAAGKKQEVEGVVSTHQDTEAIQQLRSVGIDAAAVLELTKLV